MKSEHYGLGFNASMSYKTTRIAILMLIAALSAMLLLIIGTAVEQAGLAHQYQANSIKHRRVLSLHFLDRRAVKNTRLILTREQFKNAIMHMQAIILKGHKSMWKSKENDQSELQPSIQEIENCMYI